MSICDTIDIEPSVGTGIWVSEVVDEVLVVFTPLEVLPVFVTAAELPVEAGAVELPVDGPEDADPVPELLDGPRLETLDGPAALGSY